MIVCHVLSEAIFYQRKPLYLSNTLISSQYLEKLVCQDLVLQSIITAIVQKSAPALMSTQKIKTCRQNCENLAQSEENFTNFLQNNMFMGATISWNQKF